MTEVVPEVDDRATPTEEPVADAPLPPAGWRHEASVIAVPYVLAHVLSIGGWVLATVIKRRLRGPHYVPDSYAGVFGWGSWDARYYHIIAARGYVLATGEIVLKGTARELLDSPQIQEAYLGKAAQA